MSVNIDFVNRVTEWRTDSEGLKHLVNSTHVDNIPNWTTSDIIKAYNILERLLERINNDRT